MKNKELSKDFCDKIYSKHGLLLGIMNPALTFLKSDETFFITEDFCFTCDYKKVCKLCVPTRNSPVILHICFECHWDLNMYAVNPQSIDYCRSIKEESIESLKNKAVVFRYKGN